MQTLQRSISAVIDVLIIRAMTVMLYCMTVSISAQVHNRVIRITTKRYLGKAVYLAVLYIVIMLCVHFLYFFVSERKGNSVGKRIAKYKITYEKADGRKAAIVALCKTAACVLYVITFLYFLFVGKMPYDGIRVTGEDDGKGMVQYGA